MKPLKSKLIVIALVGLFFFTSGRAQNNATNGSVKGHLQDETQTAVIFANVSLYQANDSSLVKGTSTDSLGNFRLKSIPNGHYFIKSQAIGYQAVHSALFRVSENQQTVDLKVIEMPTDSNTLGAVNLKTAKPLIQYKPGQTDINVENSIVNAGSTLMDILKKSPGIFVDQDGQITLNGRAGIQVMIDGQPSHLSGDQLASFLRSTPAGSIAKIELMNEPSTKYSAEGSAGIINIVMKKNIAEGWKGSFKVGSGYGQAWKYNGGGNLSYSGGKLSFYANYNFNHYKNKAENNINRYFYDPNTDHLLRAMHQNTEVTRRSNNHTARLGLDYALSEKETIGFDLKGSFTKANFQTYSPVRFADASGSIDSVSIGINNIHSNWDNERVNLHYKIDLDDKGSELSVNTDYNHFYEAMPQLLKTITENHARHTLERKGEQPNAIDIYAAKVDYVQVLPLDLKLESGLKSSFVKTDNNSEFQTRKNGQWHSDPGNTNHFVYKENVNAGYLNLNKDFENGWSTKVGFRAEQVNLKTDQKTTDSVNHQHYLDLFPQVSVAKAFGKNHKINLSYSRRIDRPNYQNLNPFIYYLDEYTYQMGNPTLQPQYMEKVALAYILKKKYSLNLSYNYTDDIITQIINQDRETQVVTQTSDNINSLANFNLSLNIPVSLTSWWKTYNSAQLNHDHYKGRYNDFPLDNAYFSYMLNTQQTFILSDDWKAELSAIYRSSRIMGPLRSKGIGAVSAGLQKSLWHDKASVKINIQDVFQSQKYSSSADFGDLHFNNTYKPYARTASLTFTYNFGNEKVKVNKHEDSGIENEQNRIEK